MTLLQFDWKKTTELAISCNFHVAAIVGHHPIFCRLMKGHEISWIHGNLMPVSMSDGTYEASMHVPPHV
jgi:hypothetical protein